MEIVTMELQSVTEDMGEFGIWVDQYWPLQVKEWNTKNHVVENKLKKKRKKSWSCKESLMSMKVR